MDHTCSFRYSKPSTEKITDDEITDENLVDYGPNDPENPKNWSPLYKWSVLALLSALALTYNIAILMCAPAAPQILEAFHSNNDLDATLLVTIWNLGGIFAPLLIGPLAEMYGRFPVFNIANILFCLFCVGAAESRSIGMLIAFRFFNGMSNASSTLSSSIVAELFVVEQRGRAQSLMAVMPLLGPIIGPIAGGFIAQAQGWRWTFWLATIIVSAIECAFLALYRETYDPIILRRKAKRLRKETGNQALHSHYDDKTSFGMALQTSLLRPLKVFTLPIFLLLATSASLIFGYLFLTVTTLTEVFESNYGFTEGTSGLTFVGIGLGVAAATTVNSSTLDWYTKKMKQRHNGQIKPEWRLPLMAVGGVIVPIGLFIYGWTAQVHTQFVAPIFGTALLGFGLSAMVTPMTVYFTDVFGIYRASAFAAFVVYRQIVGTILPLAGPPLFKRLGLGWGNSVLGFIALGTVPLPFFMLRYGEKIRENSKINERLSYDRELHG